MIPPLLHTWFLGMEERFYLIRPTPALFVGHWPLRLRVFLLLGSEGPPC